MNYLSLFLMLLSANLVAQFKPAKSYAIYVNYPKHSVKTTVLNDNKKTKAKDNLTYYWYSSNKIMETQGGFDGKLLDGPYSSFYLSNNLKERGQFKKGLKTGEWTTWQEDGKIHEIEEWKKGVKCGTFKSYNEKGELIKVWKVKGNKLHGDEVNYQNGKAIGVRRYYRGKPVHEITEKQPKPKKSDTTQSNTDSKTKSIFNQIDKPAKTKTVSPEVKSEKKTKKEVVTKKEDATKNKPVKVKKEKTPKTKKLNVESK